MSVLKPISEKIKLGKREYEMKFTMNVIEDIQNNFDVSIFDLGKVFGDERNQIANIKFMIMTMVNDDIDRMNDEGGEKIPHIDTRYVGRYLEGNELLKAFNGIKNIYLQNMGAETGGEPDPNPKSE